MASFLHLEGLHVFITGAASGIGSQAVRTFLEQGCNVTAHDLRPVQVSLKSVKDLSCLHLLRGDITDEESIRSCMEEARRRFGPINILIANAGITDESDDYPIWDLPPENWEKTYRTNLQGTFLTIKHFLRGARASQEKLGRELDNLAIVVIGSKTGKFGPQYGLVGTVRNEIVWLNSKGRINALALGWVNTPPQIEGMLDDSRESWTEAQTTVPLREIEGVARAIAFLASHRVAGHITGECLSIGGGIEGRLIWKEGEMISITPTHHTVAESSQTGKHAMAAIPRTIPQPPGNTVRVVVSIDLDAVSGWLGTGYSPRNVLADYSAGFFAARVGVPRLLKMLRKLGVADRCTWFIPGHSAESFPNEVQQVVDSGCEIGLHGYTHESAYQLTVQQERDVLEKCIDVVKKLTGKKPVGYRAPHYQVRESTLDLLEEYGFEYDASLTDHDCQPFFAPCRPPMQPIDFSQPASSWMRPIPCPTTSTNNGNRKTDNPQDRRPLVEVPCNRYMEDMTAIQYQPHQTNSHGYIDVRVMEQLWRDRFVWIRDNERDPIFPLVLHPDTSGMAHVIGMVERMTCWLQQQQQTQFCQTQEIARSFLEKEMMDPGSR